MPVAGQVRTNRPEPFRIVPVPFVFTGVRVVDHYALVQVPVSDIHLVRAGVEIDVRRITQMRRMVAPACLPELAELEKKLAVG